MFAQMGLTSTNVSTINFGGYRLDNVVSASRMFAGCYNLHREALTNLSNMTLQNCNKCFYMFEGNNRTATTSTTLDLSGLKLANNADVSYMFYYCPYKVIDIHNLDTTIKYSNVEAMFNYNKQLTTIYCNVDMTKQSSGSSAKTAFVGCSTQLKGGKGTAWATSRTQVTYAKPDKGGTSSSTRGYFTTK